MEISLTPLTARQAKIVEYLLVNKEAKCPALTFGVSHDSALRDIYNLMDRNIVSRNGLKRWAKYYLTPGCIITTISRFN